MLTFFVHRRLPAGRPAGRSVLSLGVPGPAGLHHGGGAGRPDHGPDRPGHVGRDAGYRLVHGGPEAGSESGLGRR